MILATISVVNNLTLIKHSIYIQVFIPT